jgi:hypothetical protein
MKMKGSNVVYSVSVSVMGVEEEDFFQTRLRLVENHLPWGRFNDHSEM